MSKKLEQRYINVVQTLRVHKNASRGELVTCTFLLAVGNHQLAERTRQELEQLDSQIEYHRFMAQKRYNNNPPR